VTVSIVKGSADYVCGWVDYHLSIGVSRMIIFDDNEEPSPLPSALAAYVNSGQVELLPASRYDAASHRHSNNSSLRINTRSGSSGSSNNSKGMDRHVLGNNTVSDLTRKRLGVFFFDKQQKIYDDVWRRVWREAPPYTWLGQVRLTMLSAQEHKCSSFVLRLMTVSTLPPLVCCFTVPAGYMYMYCGQQYRNFDTT